MSTNPHVKQVVTCAGPNCGAVRGDVNRWWAVWRESSGLKDGPIIWMCSPFEFPLDDEVLPVCGEACAHKLLSQYMSEVK